MSGTEERDTKERETKAEEREREAETAQELEYADEEREEAIRDLDRHQMEDLNQGIQTGTYDSARRGVRWPPSYRVRRKAAKPAQIREEETKDSK